MTEEWIKSLFTRGAPAAYRGDELDKIGMPIGGICTGQLYLGGDGKLWHWDIFNHPMPTGDAHYAHPPEATSPLYQWFTVAAFSAGQGNIRHLNRKDWPNITFRGQYPIGYVDFPDDHFPVAVSLEAFSPFIPLNAEDSGLPATVLHFTIKNTGQNPATVNLLGNLENAVCLYTGKDLAIRRHNRIVQTRDFTFLECTVEKDPSQKPRPPAGNTPLEEQPDFGTMGLALLERGTQDEGWTSAALGKQLLVRDSNTPPEKGLVGGLSRKWTLLPGAEGQAVFVVTWCFPNLRLHGFPGIVGRHYTKRFADARAVTQYVSDNLERLSRETRLWHQTWNDSTLPHWLLDRLFANTSILASSTCHRFPNGRFYGWEGVNCCEGTCTHVWHYAQAVARLFPELERSAREMQDLGPAFVPDTGLVRFRGEISKDTYAADGQAGVILRCYREHQMSANDAFLKRNWPRIKKAMEYLIHQDGNDDGVIENAQHNTLDTAYFGPNSMIDSLYLAALRASEEMAREAGDEAFARRVRAIFESGRKRLNDDLFNGEYFIHKVAPGHPDALEYDNGCFIDQVFGQSWAFQVGLGRILPEDRVRQALRALWKYNWAPDVGPYRAVNKKGRWYAMPGEPGMIMCTWPHGGKDAQQQNNPFAGYMNEVMDGFEYQAAGHMIWEGLLTEGLSVCRGLHERYHPSRRNPWNEVECGDHYARSMASYGVFLALCGYEYHGPKGYLAFAPRVSPEDFRAAFTAAEGWGTFTQKRADVQYETLAVHWGKLRLKTLAFTVDHDRPVQVSLTHNGQTVEATHQRHGRRIAITLASEVTIPAGQRLEVALR
ncbi:MAG: hypothetical protein JO112_11450 [Planctomycetes bacterium]|nr:hypothetical protein [Planctomycetota bacterium]